MLRKKIYLVDADKGSNKVSMPLYVKLSFSYTESFGKLNNVVLLLGLIIVIAEEKVLTKKFMHVFQ